MQRSFLQAMINQPRALASKYSFNAITLPIGSLLFGTVDSVLGITNEFKISYRV